jgi:LPPG:FO 2-phospho-L-lactate transferase
MANECLKVIGVESTAQAVGHHYGARTSTGILDCWLIHDGDYAEIDGVTVRSVPLLMTDPQATAEMVSAGLELAGVAAPATMQSAAMRRSGAKPRPATMQSAAMRRSGA